MELDWSAVIAGIYVGMAVHFAMRIKRKKDNIPSDLGIALCFAIWPLPFIAWFIRGLLK